MILVSFLIYFRFLRFLLTLSLLKQSLKSFRITFFVSSFIPSPAPLTFLFWVTRFFVPKCFKYFMWQHILSGRHLGRRKVDIWFYLEKHSFIALSSLNERTSSSVQLHLGETLTGVFFEPLCSLTLYNFSVPPNYFSSGRKLTVELTDVMTYLLTELALVKGNRQKQISSIFCTVACGRLGFCCKWSASHFEMLHINLFILLNDNPNVFGYKFPSLWKIW